MKKDEYGEIINGEETYHAVAMQLKETGSCIIGWSDEGGTHFDILFTLRPSQYGILQGGVRGDSDLFVSIMRIGSFGFEISDKETHFGYYNEKLGGNLGSTAEKLGELINKIKERVIIIK